MVLGQGKAPMGSWTEQSQVVVETVTKTSTTQQFSAPPTRQSDASKVISMGAGLKTAMVNKETTFTVDGSQAGTYISVFQRCVYVIIFENRK